MSEHAAPVQVQAPSPQLPANGFQLQRKCACGSYSGGGECDRCRDDKTKLQRAAAGGGKPNDLPSIVHDVLSSSGHALDADTRAWMEPRFNHDFSGVRVHTDERAAQSAREVNALAYTVGRDVVFGAGQYAPGTERGSRLLAHELTHVVQQTTGGRVAQAKAVSDPSDAAEIEADAMANRVMSGDMVRVTQAPSATLHAQLTGPQIGGIVAGSVAGAAGIALLIAWGAGAFDRERFSAAELTAYLTVLATTRRIEGHRDSDNKARDVVRHWRAHEPALNIDNGFSTRGGSLTGVELKRLLIKEMLAGGGENEILIILENTTTSDLLTLLDPTHGLSIQDIDRKLGGDNHARFERLLESRFPPPNGPNAAPQRQNTGETCTARQALMTDYARRRGVDEVQNAIDVLTNRTGEAAVQRVLACRFPGASPSQINDIRAVFERTLAALPRRLYHCAPEGGEAEFGTLMVTDSTGRSTPIDCLSEDAKTFPRGPGGGQSAAIDEVFLCPAFFRKSPDDQVVTVIHESVHAAGLLRDSVYDPPCGLPLSVALVNPDSYAYLAHELMSIPQAPAQAPLQRKAISEPSDAAEVEADRVASQVMSGAAAVEVNESPSAAVHAQLSSEAIGGLVAGGIVVGGVGIGLIAAAATGAFDTSRFRNCNTQDQRSAIEAATDMAQKWVDNAITQVDAVISNPARAEQDYRVVVEQLSEHFKIRPAETEHLNRLRRGLGQMQAGFGQLMFECDASCEGGSEGRVPVAYVPGILGVYLRYGRIHLCPRFFTGPRNPDDKRGDEQAEDIAHEMAHRFIGVHGDVYQLLDGRRYRDLTTEEALENADSYCQFARALFNAGVRQATNA